MGVADRLVGVSTYDNDPRVATLPRVGDYENVDWERIATLSPKQMIVQMAPERLPAGFLERSRKLGIALHVPHIDRLEDILREAVALGLAIGRPEDGEALRQRIVGQIAAVATRVDRKPRVRTLIMVSESNLGVAGRNTYLDDLLQAAGGENVLDASKGTYVQLDREALLALSPDAIIELNPSPTDAQRAAARERLKALSEVPAVKGGRVLVIEEPWALMPGAHVGELAERMGQFLHPEP